MCKCPLFNPEEIATGLESEITWLAMGYIYAIVICCLRRMKIANMHVRLLKHAPICLCESCRIFPSPSSSITLLPQLFERAT